MSKLDGPSKGGEGREKPKTSSEKRPMSLVQKIIQERVQRALEDDRRQRAEAAREAAHRRFLEESGPGYDD